MKKILNEICISLVFITVLSLALSGCSKENSNINTEQNATTYVENEDFQNFFGNFYNIAKVKNGYYFFTGMNLYYYDAKSKEAYPVCNKPNCDHNGDCTSFFSIFSYYPFELSYYNNSLYVLGWEEEGNIRHNYIYEISLDNFKRKKAAYLFDSTDSMNSVHFIIHRGYVYFLKGISGNLEERTDYIYRVKLGNKNKKKDAEKIYEFSGIGASINGLIASGNNIIISNNCYGDTNGNDYKTSYSLIDIHSLKSKEIVGNKAYSLFANGNNIFYEKGTDTVNCINLDTKEEKFFCEINGPAYISADSNYIYFDNIQSVYIDKNEEKDRKILVYDKKGNYVTEIVPKNPKDDCYFGGDDIMIFKENIVGETITNDGDTNGAKGYYVLDKSQLTTPDKQFIDMELFRVF